MKKLLWLTALFSMALGASAATYYWDDGTVTVNGASGGGGGTWAVGAAGWEDGTSAVNWADGNGAVLGGTAGTMTLGGNISAAGLTFSHTTGTYLLVGDVALRTLAVPGITIGAGGTVKLGNGTGTFSPVVILSGDVANGGTLSFGGGRMRSDGATTRTINGVVNIDAGDGNSAAYLGDAAQNGKLIFSGTVTFTGAGRGFTTYSDVDITGGLAGSGGGFTKAGNGTLTMAYSTESSLTGSVTVNGGVLEIGSTARLYNSTSYNTGAVVTVGTGGTLRMGSFEYGAAGGLGAISAYSNQRILSGGTIEITGNSQTSGCDFRVGNGSTGTFRYTAAGQTLTLGNNVNDNIRLGGALTVDAVGNITVNEQIQDNTGAGSILKTGAGTLTLGNAANNFTGNVTVHEGTLAASGTTGTTSGALGARSATRTIAVNNGATMRWTSNNILGGAGLSAADLPGIVIDGGTFETTRFNVVGPVTLNGAAMVNSNATDPVTYDGFQFIGTVTVGGSSASTLSSPTGRGNHLLGGGSTTFDVADATGDANSDLIISAVLRNGSNDYATPTNVAGLTKTGAGTLELAAANVYTGLTTVSGGTLRVSGSVGGEMTIASGCALEVAGGAWSTATVNVQSGGTVDATGDDFGGYNLSAGRTLAIGRTGTAATDLTGHLNVQGGVLRVGTGSGSAETLTITGDVVANGGEIRFDLAGTPGGARDTIGAGGLFWLLSDTTLNFNMMDGSLANGEYTLITAPGGVQLDATFNLAGLPSGGGESRQAFSVENDGVSRVYLNVTGDSATLVWANYAATSTWINGTDHDNWDNGGAADRFYDGDIVSFPDLGTGTETITLSGEVAPGSMRVNNTSGNTDYVWAGDGFISGGALTKQGTGALRIENTTDNTFAGAVHVQGGLLQVANGLVDGGTPGLLGAGTSITFDHGGTLRYTGATTSSNRSVTLEAGGVSWRSRMPIRVRRWPA